MRLRDRIRGLGAAAILLGGCAAPDVEPPTPVPATGRTADAPAPRPPRSDRGYSAAGIERARRPRLETMPADRVAAIGSEADPDEISVVFVGDVLLGHAMTDPLSRHGYHYPFEATAPLLQRADLTIANHEGALTVRTDRPTKWSQRAAPETIAGLLWAGIDAVSLANNHLRDYGDDTVRETLRHLEDSGIAAFGVGPDAAAARTPWVHETDGVRIAVLGGIAPSIFLDPDWLDDPAQIRRRRRQLLEQFTHATRRVEMGTCLYTPATLTEDVKAARQIADVVVVNLHMGVIHYRPPYRDQLQLARAAAKAGADLVVGHQAHVWQPAALIDDTAVVYGLGNYVFGFRDGLADEGLIARAVISRSSKRIDRVELFPIATNNRDPRVAFQPRLMTGDSARVVLEDLATWSERVCSTPLAIEADRAILRVPRRAPRQ